MRSYRRRELDLENLPHQGSQGRWQIEACFRVLKTGFSAGPVFVQRGARIQAHFLTSFLSLLLFRILKIAARQNFLKAAAYPT